MKAPLNIKVGDKLKDCDPRYRPRPFVTVTDVTDERVEAEDDVCMAFSYLRSRIHQNPARRSGLLHLPQGIHADSAGSGVGT